MHRGGATARAGGQPGPAKIRGPAVILVAHGSKSVEAAGASARTLAERLRAHKDLGAVEVAFIHDRPSLADALAHLADELEVCIVPLFAAEGFHTLSAIPAAVETARANRPGQILRQASALGALPAYVGSLARRLRHLTAGTGIDRSKAAFLAIGHGSRHWAVPADDAASRLADALRPDFGTSDALYLDCEPAATSWPSRIAASTLVVAPVFFSDARHVARDVPHLFGLADHPPAIADALSGPWIAEGRSVWYADLPAVTSCVVNLIADLALSATKEGAEPMRAMKPT